MKVFRNGSREKEGKDETIAPATEYIKEQIVLIEKLLKLDDIN
jgi:hypothetical protein